MNKKDETSRDRRIHAAEERTLLDTALTRMNTPEHQYVGPLLLLPLLPGHTPRSGSDD
jgi:hypothetical protein